MGDRGALGKMFFHLLQTFNDEVLASFFTDGQRTVNGRQFVPATSGYRELPIGTS